uniref:Uncharacterized protein n=1 Tax=Cucumis melo TaxID=3656 RepID=A0A9I9E6C9_CUCME
MFSSISQFLRLQRKEATKHKAQNNIVHSHYCCKDLWNSKQELEDQIYGSDTLIIRKQNDKKKTHPEHKTDMKLKDNARVQSAELQREKLKNKNNQCLALSDKP